MVQDTIDQSIDIDATAERVWSLVSEPGWWINDGAYRAHRIEPADGHDVVHDEKHGAFAIRTEKLEPPRYARFAWLPGAGRVLEDEPGTVVELYVDDRAGGGVTLRVVESGFAGLAGDDERRRRAREENDRGWAEELEVARAHVEAT